MTTMTITVQEIHCAGCENTIRRALGAQDGVRRVKASADTDTVEIAYDEQIVSEDDLRVHLADIGYPPVD